MKTWTLFPGAILLIMHMVTRPASPTGYNGDGFIYLSTFDMQAAAGAPPGWLSCVLSIILSSISEAEPEAICSTESL